MVRISASCATMGIVNIAAKHCTVLLEVFFIDIRLSFSINSSFIYPRLWQEFVVWFWEDKEEEEEDIAAAAQFSTEKKEYVASFSLPLFLLLSLLSPFRDCLVGCVFWFFSS